MQTSQPSGDPTPAYLKALGSRELPEAITTGGISYRKSQIFKNDFFAVTALYEGDAGQVLLKVGRQAGLFHLPLRWLGRRLAAREMAALEQLQDLDGIPRLIDSWEDTGFIREFVRGHPLEKEKPVDDEFHGRLARLIDEIHSRSMAYVDLEKCENVLVGEDGRPYLFDFQICWNLPARRGGDLWPCRAARKFLQKSDRYHLLKLRRRTRPDQMSQAEVAASYRKPWYLRIHYYVARPFTRVRRAVLNRIDPKTQRGERGRVAESDS